MAHALAAFITERMDELHLRQRDVVTASGLSRAVVSKYAADERERLGRLPERDTLAGFAKALRVPMDVMVGKAVEALGLGYSSGDFISTVADASNEELLAVILDRLNERGEAHDGAPSTNEPGASPGNNVTALPQRTFDTPGTAVASGGGTQEEAAEADRLAAIEKAKQQEAMDEMERKKRERSAEAEEDAQSEPGGAS